MEVREQTRQEIEDKFSEMGDYVKMDYLSSCLKKSLDFDTRKFVMTKLAGLYEVKGMFKDAGELLKGAAEINTTFQSKITDFTKSAELLIRGGDYESAEVSVKRALNISNSRQREEIKRSITEIYKIQARALVRADKRRNAVAIYEKLLERDLGIDERLEIRKNLLNLYEGLGELKKYGVLKRRFEKESLENNS